MGKFSLGMRQRLQLATALLGDPEILILDEPSNGLDPQGIQWLRTFIRHQASLGHAVLVSSHLLVRDGGDGRRRGHRVPRQAGPPDHPGRAGHPGRDHHRPAHPVARACPPAPDPRRHPGGLSAVGARHHRHRSGHPEWFGPLAAQHQIVLYELVHERGSLEEVFLSITHGFDAANPSQAGNQPDPFGAVAPATGPATMPGGAAMIAAIRSEWLKLRTTAVPWVLGWHRPGGHRPAHSGVLRQPQRGGGGQQRAATAPSGSPTTPTPPSSSGTSWAPDSPAICSPCCSAPSS